MLHCPFDITKSVRVTLRYRISLSAESFDVRFVDCRQRGISFVVECKKSMQKWVSPFTGPGGKWPTPIPLPPFAIEVNPFFQTLSFHSVLCRAGGDGCQGIRDTSEAQEVVWAYQDNRFAFKE